ncbi:3'(2'),5'-bisphosphate nucleotidase CysQ [Luteimonas lutimaris]|uniref:3'(2'),5'-bisphosphate nucleotidase CysQ n=1 Tax=Luteimonas lutimaris TaxID=698645 RepID=A0ABP7M6U0_9GAMM|nr:3'(2'),5'-bisphosphate nucleotidase CysQ [Luteimonas sp.]
MPVAEALREGVIAAAREAAAEILRVYDTCFEVDHKADDSPLTAADLAAHRCILARLQTLTPDIPVLSEESADTIPTGVRRSWNRLWVVDPLDGTREFVKRNGEFTVNIALVEGGEVVFGVIQAPVTGVLWHGARGQGAFRRDGDAERALHTRIPARAPLRVAASRSHRNARTESLLDRIAAETGAAGEPVALGSSLKFCRLAEGGMDVYPRFGPTSEWDTAAGQAIVEAAGGAVLDPRGRPLRYNQRDTVLNGDFMALGDPSLPWKEWVGDRA